MHENDGKSWTESGIVKKSQASHNAAAFKRSLGRIYGSEFYRVRVPCQRK